MDVIQKKSYVSQVSKILTIDKYRLDVRMEVESDNDDGVSKSQVGHIISFPSEKNTYCDSIIESSSGISLTCK